MAHHIRSMPISYILAVDVHRTVGRGQVEIAPIGDRGTQHYPGTAYLVQLVLAENHALDRTTSDGALLVSRHVWSGSKPCRPSS